MVLYMYKSICFIRRYLHKMPLKSLAVTNSGFSITISSDFHQVSGYIILCYISSLFFFFFSIFFFFYCYALLFYCFVFCSQMYLQLFLFVCQFYSCLYLVISHLLLLASFWNSHFLEYETAFSFFVFILLVTFYLSLKTPKKSCH